MQGRPQAGADVDQDGYLESEPDVTDAEFLAIGSEVAGQVRKLLIALGWSTDELSPFIGASSSWSAFASCLGEALKVEEPAHGEDELPPRKKARSKGQEADLTDVEKADALQSFASEVLKEDLASKISGKPLEVPPPPSESWGTVAQGTGPRQVQSLMDAMQGVSCLVLGQDKDVRHVAKHRLIEFYWLIRPSSTSQGPNQPFWHG